MASVFSTLIYVGNFADVDTDESNNTTENGNLLAGTYSNATMSIHTLEFEDDNNDGAAPDDEWGIPYEYVNYDVGAGPQTQIIDSTSVYNGSVLLGDGSSFNTPFTVIQMQNGDVFVAEYINNGTLDGLNIQSITLDPNPDTNFVGFFNDSNITGASVVCFARNTQIQTTNGLRPIQSLNIGDMVLTLDNGPQPIRWIGGQFHANPGTHAPICIAPDTFAPNQPDRPLLVSPQHRLFLRNKVSLRMFGENEVLVAAKSLLSLPGVHQTTPETGLTYWYLAFDRHEVIEANGLWAETLYPGPMTCAALPSDALAELRQLLPHYASERGPIPMARVCPPMRRQQKLMQRLSKNAKSLVEPLAALH